MRFIIPVLPLLTLPVAISLHRLLPIKFIDLSPNVQGACGLNNNYSESNLMLRFLVDDKNEMDNLEKREKSLKYSLHCFVNTLFSNLVLLVLLCTLFCTYFFTLASKNNYPGGEALDRLLTIHIPHHVSTYHSEALVNVNYDDFKFSIHIDAATAMSGVTLFGQDDIIYSHPSILNHNYINVDLDLEQKGKIIFINYSKEENLKNFTQFDYLLTENYR